MSFANPHLPFSSKRIFWADALEDRIEATNFDGKNREKIVAHAPHPFGVTVFQSYVYWSDWYNRSIYRAPIAKDGSPVQEVRRGLRGALELRAVSESRQQDHHVNPCQHENGGCTHLCLFREKSYVCTCPDKADGRECKTSESAVAGTFENDLATENSVHDSSKNDKDESAAPPVIIIATCILTFILILVIIAILVLVLKSRRKKEEEDRTTSESSRSMLTFSNPNYNCADGQGAANPGEPSGSGNQKGWKKKFKYDKAAVSGTEADCQRW